ncbi:MAG: hypothetical protein QOI38_3128 [Sphingomonadales bacterium]|jgi:phage virion morphogenesis protein|nr:hypothetical protein [Sphingomonadales bacterium]
MAAPIDIRLEFQEDVTAGLRRGIAAGLDMTPAMQEIARHLETATAMHFEQERGPGGVAWKPSERAIAEGGQTLTMSGDLRSSISSTFGPDFAAAGPERSFGAAVYAAIHQFGGTIRAKAGRALSFGGRLFAAVRIPARAYLGIDDQDRAAIADILRGFFGRAFAGAGGGE